MLDFQEELIPLIAERFKELRDNKDYKIPPDTIANGQKSAILRIEKGKNTKSGNFITDTLLDAYVDYFKKSKEELIFGTSDEIEFFLSHIFLDMLYPLFPHAPEKQAELDASCTPLDSKIQEASLELLYAFADFGRWWNLRRNIEPYEQKKIHIDQHAMLKMLWLMCKKKMLLSFTSTVIYPLFNDISQKFHYNRINKTIQNWLLHHFSKQVIPEIIDKLKSDSIFKMGYMVKNLAEELLVKDLPTSYLTEIPLKEFYLPTKSYSFNFSDDEKVNKKALKKFVDEWVEFQCQNQEITNLEEFDKAEGVTDSECVTVSKTPFINQTRKINIEDLLDSIIELPDYFTEDHILDYPMMKVPGILTVNSQASNLFQIKFNKTVEYLIDDLVKIQNGFINCIKHSELSDFAK